MRGLIILDGPDGSGKTTLAKEIVRQTGGRYMHLTYRFKEKMFTYHLAALHRAVKLSQTQMVVIDRLWMSELAYANAYRNGSKWPLMYRMLERIILKHAGLEVLCLPNDLSRQLDEYKALKASREEMYHDIAPVCIEYHKLWDKVKTWPHMRRYDRHEWAIERVEDYANQLIVEQQAWQNDQIDLALDPHNYNLCGHISPAQYLLVGANRKGWYPYVDYSPVSVHVAQVLDTLRIEEHQVMWTSYAASNFEADALIPTYDLLPFTLGQNEYVTWINAYGGMSAMHKIPPNTRGMTQLLTMSYLNNVRQVIKPELDLSNYHGKKLLLDLSGEIQRHNVYREYYQ